MPNKFGTKDDDEEDLSEMDDDEIKKVGASAETEEIKYSRISPDK